jgi:alpha-ketoglutarate-dependent taurine dioxygenase
VEPSHTISGDTVAALRRRTVPAGQAPDAWPTDRFEPHHPSLLAVADQILAEVRGSQGHAVVSIDPVGLDDHELCTVTWNLFTMLCSPVPQYRTGELIYAVEVTPGVAETSHYSGSARAGGHHTDGTLLPEPPDVACLLGLSAAVGGETIMMDGRRLCAQLDADDPAHTQILAQPHHFDVMGQIDGVITKRQPVVRRGADDFELRYLRRYIEQGYQVAGETLPTGLRSAMDLLDDLSTAEENQTRVLLDRGVILIWDNRRMLHGRLPFEERGSRRRLRRMYGTL